MNFLHLFSLANLGEVIKNAVMSLGDIYFVLFYGIGVIAIGIKVTEVQLRKRSKILFLSMICSALWIVYYLLGGNITSALTGLLSVVRSLIFMQRGKHKWASSIFWLIFFLVAQTLIGVFTFSSWRSLFAVTAGYLQIIAYYVMKENIYRLVILFSFLCWMGNSISNGLWVALCSDTFGMVSTIVAIVRYDLKKIHKQKS